MQRLITILVTAGVVLGTLGLIGLGFWQLQRLEERRTQNALIVSRMDLPALVITGEILDAAELEYRPATVTGVYDFAEEIVLRNRAKSNLPGVHIITPLRINGSDKAVLVDRGWIPYEYSQRSQRQPYGLPEGTVTIAGLIRLSQSRPSPISPGDPNVNADMPRLDAWYWLNIPQIQVQFRSYGLLPFYIEQDPGPDPNALPAPEHSLELGDGPHLSYAVQWFSFAAILATGSSVLAYRTRKRGANAG